MTTTSRVLLSVAFAAAVLASAAIGGVEQWAGTSRPADLQDPDARDRAEFGQGPMLALARLARAGDAAALQREVALLRGRVPLVEADPAAPGRRIVTFLHFADPDVRLVMLPQLRFGTVAFAEAADSAGAPGPRSVGTPFKQLWGSRLWYLRLNLPSTARIGYTVGVERLASGEPADTGRPVSDEFLDPLNPSALGVRGDVSVVTLPDAPPEAWLARRPGVSEGRLDAQSIRSTVLGDSRRVTVYTPAGYDAMKVQARLLFVFDGDYFASDLRVPTILDNLHHERRVPPTIAVFVDGQATRDRDYLNSAPFADFVVKELHPWVTSRYRVTRDPRYTAVAGASFGALQAAFIALRNPAIFGSVLSQSGAFWPPAAWSPAMPAWQVLERDSAIIDDYVRTPRQPIRFYMDCGLYEPAMLAGNRRLRDVLRSKGYAVTYVERAGTHNGLAWRQSIGEGIVALLGGDGK